MRAVWPITKLVFKEIFRKKDFYVALILIGVVLLYVSQMKFYDVSNVVRYVREVGLALIFLFSVFLAVPLAARQVYDERQQRTLAVLLAKPVSRLEFILGKFAGSALAGCACFLIFYGIFAVFALGTSDPVDTACLVQTGFLFCLCLVVLTSMASALSQKLTPAANITVTVLLYFIMSFYGEKIDLFSRRAASAARAPAMALYYVLPHFEFFDMRQRLIHDWGPAPAGLVSMVALYAAVYTAVFLLLGWVKFRRQDL